MTPKRLQWMLFIADKRENAERLADLHIRSVAQHGEKKDLDRLVKDLSA